MQLIRGMHNIRSEHRDCVVTIGNFDGVHLGHRTILEALRQQAFEFGVKACVITFEPPSKEYFHGQLESPRISSLREKLNLLEEAGVNQVLCLPFNKKLQNLTSDDFVVQVLVSRLGLRYLIVGDDFRYGLNREGDFTHLCKMGDEHRFTVCDTRTIALDMDRISSTRIREKLATMDMIGVAKLLGRPFTIIGRVIKGQQLGRKLAFPSANIRILRRSLPIQGVFAVRVSLNGRSYNAVANFGTRPTMMKDSSLSLEVHLLDYKGDLYDQILHVAFIQKIRNEKKFKSLDELQISITNDIRVARRIFLNNSKDPVLKITMGQ